MCRRFPLRAVRSADRSVRSGTQLTNNLIAPMAWVETESLSFTARHETEDEGCATRTLDRLEDLRLRLEDRFDEAPGGITVIIHPSPGWLAAAHPFLPSARLPAPPARL